MWLFYVMAFVPVIIGAGLWLKSREIVWWEWAISALVGFALSAIFHAALLSGMTADVETWSGQVTHVEFHPKWIEEYQQMHTRTVGSGKNQRTEIYFTTEHRTHHEYWMACVDYGTVDDEYEIERSEHDQMAQQLGGKVVTTKPHKSGFDGGDPNLYTVRNTSRVVIPAHRAFRFENRVKAAPSVFSYQVVSDDSPVFDYPKIQSWRYSNRLLGKATLAVPLIEWDRLNSRLGPSKKVNLILVGFDSTDSQLGHLQEAKWYGGKKNDLVLCYGETEGKVRWSYCFGWTESERVKRELETLLLKRTTGMAFVQSVESEVRKNYQIKDWSKFDYISIEPPVWSYIVFIVVLGIAQTTTLIVASINDSKKGRSYTV